jgi:hypothetical protein
MARPASTIADRLSRRAVALNRYVRRIERLVSDGRMPVRDARVAYAGAYMAYHVQLEAAIEDLFMGLLMQRVRIGGGASRPIVHVGSEAVAKAVVRGGRAYVPWLPIDGTRKRATTFLSRGAPFSTLTSAEKATLERAQAIRNALAHPGPHALRRFQADVIGGVAVPPDQRRPDGYLRGQHAVGQTRFEYLLAECGAVFRRLCS